MSGSLSSNRIVGTGLGSIGLTLDLRIGPHLLRYWNLHSCAIPPTTEGRSGEEPTSRIKRANLRDRAKYPTLDDPDSTACPFGQAFLNQPVLLKNRVLVEWQRLVET